MKGMMIQGIGSHFPKLWTLIHVFYEVRRYAEVIVVKTKDWPFIGSHSSICVMEGKEGKKLCHLYQLTTFKKITTAFSHMLVRTCINLRWAQNSYPQGRSLYGHEQDGGTKTESVLSIFLQCHNICLWKWAGIKFRKAGAIRTETTVHLPC